jgi:hypothetical protein
VGGDAARSRGQACLPGQQLILDAARSSEKRCLPPSRKPVRAGWPAAGNETQLAGLEAELGGFMGDATNVGTRDEMRPQHAPPSV